MGRGSSAERASLVMGEARGFGFGIDILDLDFDDDGRDGEGRDGSARTISSAMNMLRV